MDGEPVPLRPCMAGFAQVPADLYAAVSPRAAALWGVIDIHQRGNGATWPSREHLADDLGWSVDSVKRAVGELEAAGWLTVARRRGRGNTNRYQVIHSPRKGRTRAPFYAENGARVHRENGAPVHHRNIGKETDESGRSGLVTPDRARGASETGCRAAGCSDGWLDDDPHGRAVPCPTCRPHLTRRPA